ncbi:hypothetical protein EZJ19_13230 [Parasulfuritortus cantonensis]|uniref:Uncharacterized protein n=1 Tax=Parasulfuritortus cantonensis TaxID=2528202 RepID=A0A4R1B728_9PROT|nr:hypothetical protein [Parasulfuritortus cantonensis]TCJ11925.1 hypothetical protein EZJ19_13230 [Parasulfuritortus cantonensis]
MTASQAAAGPVLRAPVRYHFDQELVRHRVAPILGLAGEKDMDTVLYLALVELHKLYPSVPDYELEGLLQDIIRQAGRS